MRDSVLAIGTDIMNRWVLFSRLLGSPSRPFGSWIVDDLPGGIDCTQTLFLIVSDDGGYPSNSRAVGETDIASGGDVSLQELQSSRSGFGMIFFSLSLWTVR